MFYADKLTSIRSTDRVLEIGPGATPHARSDAFLELEFESADQKISQRGGGVSDGNFGGRPVYYYDGNIFPFGDGEFDYVICSHVVEHVEDPEAFMREVFRVGGGRGYIEYPLITYEYLYSFDVHVNFVKFDFDAQTLRYMQKSSFQFHSYAPVHALFYKTLEGGWDDLCASNPQLFFEGFEFDRRFGVELTSHVNALCPSASVIRTKSPLRRLLGRLMKKLKI